jgi:hypothetical protein
MLRMGLMFFNARGIVRDVTMLGRPLASTALRSRGTACRSPGECVFAGAAWTDCGFTW